MVKRNMRRMRSPPHSYKNVIIKIIIPFSQSLFESRWSKFAIESHQVSLYLCSFILFNKFMIFIINLNLVFFLLEFISNSCGRTYLDFLNLS